MSWKQKKVIRATDGDFKVFIALRQNGVELDEIVQDMGRTVAMGLESIYQKFYRGGLI
jgi:hypothetical protein